MSRRVWKAIYVPCVREKEDESEKGYENPEGPGYDDFCCLHLSRPNRSRGSGLVTLESLRAL